MYRTLSILILLAATLDASQASAMIFVWLPPSVQAPSLNSGPAPNLLPGSTVHNALPFVESPHVPVYQTYSLPPPRPPKPSPVFVPDSQNPSRRRHLGW